MLYNAKGTTKKELETLRTEAETELNQLGLEYEVIPYFAYGKYSFILQTKKGAKNHVASYETPMGTKNQAYVWLKNVYKEILLDHYMKKCQLENK